MEKDYHVGKVVNILVIIVAFTEAAVKDPAWKHCMHNVHAFTGKWGSIKSPGFPNGINTQIQCSWVIQSNPGYKVKLAFHTLNMTGSRGSCYTQFVEILDYKVGHSMGKFCGASRPGDYVSYGYKVRFDLQGDTSGAKTKGFDLRYRAVKEVGGFKTSWAINTKSRGKNRRQSSSKTRKPTGPAKVFGRNPRKGSTSTDSPSSETGGKPGASRTQSKPSRPPAPNRVEFRSPTPRRTMGPVIYGANHNARAVDHGRSSVITMEPDTSATTLDYTIIAGIAAGGAVLLVIVIVVLKLCVCDKAKRKKKAQDGNAKPPGIPDGQLGFSMVPLPGIIPEQQTTEEIMQRHPSFNRTLSWSGVEPTISYLQYPAAVNQSGRRVVAAMSHPGIRSSRSRSRTDDRYRSKVESSKSYGSQRSESRARRSRSRPHSEAVNSSHSRSRSLSYLPSEMNGWVRVDDQPVSRRKRQSHSDFESTDESDSNSSYTESDSSDDYRRRKSRSRRKHSSRGSLKRNKFRHQTKDDDRPPPYYVIEKGRDFDEGYDTGRIPTNAHGVKSRKSQPSGRHNRKGKRSRKYSY